MINRIKELPEISKPSAEVIKLKNMAAAYPDEIQLFAQTDSGAVLSLLGKDVIIAGDINAQEVKQFLNFLKPESVFSSADNLAAVFGEGAFECVNTLIKKGGKITAGNMFSYDFSSDEAYALLKEGGFLLPEYEYFATDYCRRKNRGLLRVFGKKETCIALTLQDKEYRLVSGIVSKAKGLGGALLLAAAGGNRDVLAVCRDELLPFYTKYGFEPLYKAGYWRKHS